MGNLLSTGKSGSFSRSEILSKSDGMMLVPSMLWRLLDIYQHGEGWGHLEGWIKRVIISALLPMSAFLWWVWTMRRMAPHSIVSNTSYTTSCLASFSFSFLPPSIPCLCPSLPLFFLSSILLFISRETLLWSCLCHRSGCQAIWVPRTTILLLLRFVPISLLFLKIGLRVLAAFFWKFDGLWALRSQLRWLPLSVAWKCSSNSRSSALKTCAVS